MSAHSASWVRRGSDLAIVTTEALALFVLGDLLAGLGGRPGPDAGTVLVAAGAGYVLARALSRFDLPRRALIFAGGAVSLAGLWFLAALQYGGLAGPGDLTPLQALAMDPLDALNGHLAVVAGLVVLGAAWLRGVQAAGALELSQPAVLRSLTVGLGIVVVGLSLGRASISSRAMDQAALPFFVSGLTALALINLNQSDHVAADSWRGPWLLVLAGTIGALTLVAAVAGLIPLGALNRLLAPVGSALLLVLDLLLYALAIPMVLAVNWVLLHLLSGRLHPLNLPSPPSLRTVKQPPRPTHPSGLELALAGLGHLLVLLVLVSAVGLLLWWAFQRLQRSAPGGATTREAAESEGGLAADLRALLATLWSPRPGPPRPAAPALSPRLLVLRAAYLKLLRHAAARKLPRPAAATPREFAGELRTAFDAPAAEALSLRFSAGRYGLVEPSDEALAELVRQVEREVR